MKCMKKMKKQILMIIKVMSPAELTDVSDILEGAFADKFTDKTALSAQEVKTLMKLLWLKESQVFGLQPYVLKDGDEVVAAFGITGQTKKRCSVSFIAIVLAVLRQYGVRELFHFAKTGLETSRSPADDELYIDFIAVKASRRDENIGHRVMEAIDALKAKEPGIRKVSLYVLKDNGPARHLYTKFGFQPLSKYEKSAYLFMMKTS